MTFEEKIEKLILKLDEKNKLVREILLDYNITNNEYRPYIELLDDIKRIRDKIFMLKEARDF